MVNALRKVEAFQELEVRLQSNEVLVHAPTDVTISEITDAIYDAGFQPDDTIWMNAYGIWEDEGFTPMGWSQTISLESEVISPTGDGPWKLVFKKVDDSWKLEEVGAIEKVPQVRDVDQQSKNGDK